MASGGTKDAAYIAKYMEEHMLKYDPNKTLTDLLLFDGASSVQKGGDVLEAIFPRVTVIHGGEHVISLFFDDVAKLAPIKALITRACRLYNIFGSGAMHAPHAQLIAQSKLFNGGIEVGLLRGASTRMATWFYALFRLLRMRVVLEATIHHANFRGVHKNDRMKKAIEDISNPAFWRAMFSLSRLTWCVSCIVGPEVL